MSDRMHIATRKGLFTAERNGGRWRITRGSFVGDNCSMMMHDPRDGALYAALGHGHFGVKVHRSGDDGATWQEIATPRYPEMPEGVQPQKHPFSGKEIRWNLELIWELRPGGADQPGRIWCGTLPGGLFRSDDHGESWALNETLWNLDARQEWFGGGYDEPGIHSVCVDPRDSSHVMVAISCGGAWRSEDDGGTWEARAKGMRAEYMPPERAYDVNIQDPHLLAQCRDQPDRLWVQHHNGVFHSADCGRSWQECENIQPSGFGFAVAVHPANPDIAWFVPGIKDEKRIPVDGRLIVNRTSDGGRTFEALTAGLPQEHAYDLVFRHALDVDETGERLVFGSTTGSVWTSDNGGDSWQVLSHHLPPVHAIRFDKP